MKSCKSCWWQEGGLCYLEPCKRQEDGRSIKQAIELCNQYWNKRTALETVIPAEKLVITSELRYGKEY